MAKTTTGGGSDVRVRLPLLRGDRPGSVAEATTDPAVARSTTVQPTSPATSTAGPDAKPEADRAAYYAELANALGMNDVMFWKTESGGELTVDRRGEEQFAPEKLKGLPAVVQQVLRGRIGMMFHAATGVADAGHAFETAALGPLAVALLEPGDGAAEALLATAATSTYILAGRVASRLSDHLSRPGATEQIQAYGKLHAKMTNGMAAALATLARVRAYRRNWDADLQLVRRRSEDGDHVDVHAAATH